MKPKVLIAGSSGHAKVILDIFEKEGNYEIIGFLDAFREAGEETLGYEVLGSEKDLPELLKSNDPCEIFIAIGDNWTRKKVRDKILEFAPNAVFAKTVHPSAQIGKEVAIGQGTAVMAGAIINSDTKIGNFVIVNTNASIDHDCQIGDFSSLAPNATLGGSVILGEFVSVAIGASIKDGIEVGKQSVIGAGSMLLNDSENNTVSYGVPAKEIRKRKKGDKYM